MSTFWCVLCTIVAVALIIVIASIAGSPPPCAPGEHRVYAGTKMATCVR